MNSLKNVMIVAGVMWFILPSLGAQTTPPTNEQVLYGLLSRPILAVFDSLNTPTTRLRIIAKKNNEMETWFVDKLRQQFINKKVVLYDSIPDEKEGLLTLVIENVSSRITYLPRLNLLLRAGKYTRNVSAAVAFYFKSGDELILVNRNKQLDFHDQIKGKQVKKVENKIHQFTIGTKSESKLIRRLIEPVLVVTTTIGVVYLLYSLRSGS